MARGDIPREKKKLKGKRKTGENMQTSSAPVFTLPRLIEKKKKQE